jgi:YVTN family beta-propeller protein
VYVTAVRSGEVLIVDSRTFDLIGRIPVGEEPHEIAFTMDA